MSIDAKAMITGETEGMIKLVADKASGRIIGVHFLADHTDYASGVGSWDPSAAGEKRPYRITVVFDENAPDPTQGASLTDLSFVWEVQS